MHRLRTFSYPIDPRRNNKLHCVREFVATVITSSELSEITSTGNFKLTALQLQHAQAKDNLGDTIDPRRNIKLHWVFFAAEITSNELPDTTTKREMSG